MYCNWCGAYLGIKLTGTTIFGSPATDYFCYFSYSGVEPIWDQIAAHHLEVAVLSSVTFLSIYGNTMVTLVMATLAACQLLQPTITKYGTGFIGSINLFSSGFWKISWHQFSTSSVSRKPSKGSIILLGCLLCLCDLSDISVHVLARWSMKVKLYHLSMQFYPHWWSSIPPTRMLMFKWVH